MMIAFDMVISRLHIAKKRIGKLEDRSADIIQKEHK